MSKFYKIIEKKSWATTSQIFVGTRQNYLQKRYGQSLVQPYPAGASILGDSAINISSLPVNIQNKFTYRTFGFPSATIGVNSERGLPILSFLIGRLDLEENTSSYEIVESQQTTDNTTSANDVPEVPSLFETKEELKDGEVPILWSNVSAINIPLLTIFGNANPDYKKYYGNYANFSKSERFTVIKNIWSPLTFLQTKNGPITSNGLFHGYQLTSSMPLYQD